MMSDQTRRPEGWENIDWYSKCKQLEAENARLRADNEHMSERGLEVEAWSEQLQAENARLRELIPPSFVKQFMKHRHFWAAHEIDVVARKDAREYRLEGDWLKEACRALTEPDKTAPR